MTVHAPAEVAPKPLRADAERNRTLILEVAGQVFAEKGLDAGFDEIARRAGVGAGTVYRRFPHRDELIEALLTHRLDELTKLVELHLRNPDAWAGLVEFLHSSIEMQIEDRGLRELMERSGRWADCSIDAKSKLVEALVGMLTRAQDQGAIRDDVEIADIGIVTTLVSSIHDPEQPDLWRRYLALFLDGLRVDRSGPTPLPLAAPSEKYFKTKR